MERASELVLNVKDKVMQIRPCTEAEKYSRREKLPWLSAPETLVGIAPSAHSFKQVLVDTEG